MTNSTKKMYQKRVSAVAIVFFLCFFILCSLLIYRTIINRLKIEELLMGQQAIREWYRYSENIILIIAGILLNTLVFFIVSDNFRLRRINAVIEQKAITDALTGIFNRRYLEENLSRVIRAISRGDNSLSVLMVDVDFFKNYNDTYGHNAGDNCLRTVAEVLARGISREEDFVARYGGEEFVVVLPYTDETGAKTVAERLLASIHSRKILHETSEIAKIVTFSIGGTTSKVSFTHNGIDYVNLADKALYLSKQNGRDKYSFLSSLPV